MVAKRRRRITAIAMAVAAVTLTAGLATGCEFDDSLDCLSNADTIADSITAIHEAGADAIEDPTRTQESIDTIERNVDKIDETTDDSKVDDAVDDLNKAIADYNKAILNGDTDPDSSKIDAAADELRSVCSP
ncbi:hypothetical protein OHT76_38250 [Streptomyces sp. NBC_00287]|uniref:hypothetical protein n=1 Tax=Streptomyces sp. NBC_00287 TaxID=2975702 RepID=UPI002E2C1402|nr:hypothetical protein [Streptomyces sp. NBC_00287]